MRLSRPRSALVPLVVASALAIAACGGSNNSNSNSNGGGNSGGNSSGNSGGTASSGANGYANVDITQSQQKGGTLNVVSAEGWEHLDPGQSYFQIDYLVVNVTQRPLYAFTPDSKLVPDVAAGPPQISSDGKTVTVKIKPNIKYGGADAGKTVTSADVAYAFQRDFNPNVPNAYASSYYPIEGADKSKGKPISGIETPDKTTIVFHLTSDFGATFVQALTLPGSAPVPEDVAGPMDQTNPSKYDTDVTKQAFTGAYMIKDYKAGRSITLVRNPNWDSTTDFRPAYADEIDWKAGGDPNVLARQTLNSPDLLMADGPPAPVLKTAFEQKKDQLSISTLGNRYVSLNTKVAPFNNVNLRRAVIAVSDRNAYLLARGGQLVGQVSSHFLGPEIPGFQEAGGVKGFGIDFVANPSGDMKVACKYMTAAHYPNCKYTGKYKSGASSVTIVGSNADPGPKEMQIVQADLQKLGIKSTIKAVPQQTMYSKFCGYVKAEIEVCPTAGWIEDFPDPYAYLYVPFSGKAIVPVNNSNWQQEDNPQINAAMDKAAQITDPAQRRHAWANVDKMLVQDAAAIPEIWEKGPLVKGSQVKAVLDKWNDDWDLSFSAPK
jgi:peptide/nickel transport system substrate-binding protein